jgi:membrane protease YdiL (CAAX protease family)
MTDQPALPARFNLRFKQSWLVVFCLALNLVFCTPFINNRLLVFGVFFLFTITDRQAALKHLSLLFLLVAMLEPAGRIWPLLPALPAPLPLFIPLLVSTLMVLPSAAARQTLGWFRRGTMDHPARVLTFITAIGSVGALLLWARWSNNLGVGMQTVQGLTAYPRWLILCCGVPLFALTNAFVEEAVFRGVVQEALQRTFGPSWVVLVLQATVFAAAHYAAGFPNGQAGYALVLVYGGMLGYLRLRTQGLLAPWLAHVVSDLVIGYVLVSLA